MLKMYIKPDVFTLLDDEDYYYLSMYRWYVDSSGYAVGRINDRTIAMSRLIMNASEGMEVDHINGDRLDNQRKNLRICTHQQNHMNLGIRKSNLSGFKGVSFSKQRNKYRADIKFKGKATCLGFFDTMEEALDTYNEVAKERFGEYYRN